EILKSALHSAADDSRFFAQILFKSYHRGGLYTTLVTWLITDKVIHVSTSGTIRSLAANR
ncbi:MAG: hypothetical protein WA220_10990, partial [Candidatus Nitrosopolaris sp.]